MRSCFLQGLLTFDNKPPKKIFGIKKHLTQWKKWCDEKNISYTKACLHYIKNKKFIDYLIVGFNNTEQLNVKETVKLLLKLDYIKQRLN